MYIDVNRNIMYNLYILGEIAKLKATPLEVKNGNDKSTAKGGYKVREIKI